MIISRIGKWNQDAGQGKGGELRETSRTGPRNDQIGGAVSFFHSVVKRRNAGRKIFASIVICNQTFIARAGKMNYLYRNAPQKRQRFNHRLINSTRALAASHHEDRHEILLESEFLTRLPSIQTHQFGPDWSPCNFCVVFWKKRRAL